MEGVFSKKDELNIPYLIEGEDGNEYNVKMNDIPASFFENINFRKTMAIDINGRLLEDTDLGVCTPSFAGALVMNQSDDGWLDWHTMDGRPIDIYRKTTEID